MNKLISIIVPVYNSEATIYKTLLSIKNQTYGNFEVLIVNDGSKDNSLNIIKDFCKNDSRFLYFDINNQGVSNARNVGLDNASGDYVVFLDSDDTLQNNYFENIICDIGTYQFLTYSIKTINNGSEKIIEADYEIDHNVDKIKFVEYLTSARLFANCTNKVFLSKKLKNIRFNTNTNLGEDYEFVLHYFMTIDSYKYIKKDFYVYDLTTGNLGFNNKKDTYRLKSIGNLRMLEFYKQYHGDLNVVYNEFVKAFVLDMMMLMTSDGIKKKDMIDNQNYCMNVFNLKCIDTSLKNKILIKVFNSKSFILVLISSYLIKYLNFFVKKIKYGL